MSIIETRDGRASQIGMYVTVAFHLLRAEGHSSESIAALLPFVASELIRKALVDEFSGKAAA